MADDLNDLQNKRNQNFSSTAYKQNPGGDIVEEGTDDTSPTQSPAEWGEAHGSAQVPTGESTEDMVEDITGEPLKPGETLADFINQSEKDRTIGFGEEPTEEDLANLEEEEKEETLADVIKEDVIDREPGVERLEDLEEPEEEEEESEDYEG